LNNQEGKKEHMDKTERLAKVLGWFILGVVAIFTLMSLHGCSNTAHGFGTMISGVGTDIQQMAETSEYKGGK